MFGAVKFKNILKETFDNRSAFEAISYNLHKN